MNTCNLVVLTSLLIFIFCLDVQSQVSPHKFGKGIHVYGQDSTFHLRFGFRFQNLFTTEFTSVDGSLEDASANFLVRRARLKFDGFAFSPKLKYKMELGLSNRDIGGGSGPETNRASRLILDAFITWNFYKNFSLKVGQGKLPGNRERVISSGNLQFVDRSRVNSRFNIDRDYGIQILHHFKPGKGDFLIKEVFSLSQGEGRNLTSGNIGGLDYTFRVELLPFGTFQSSGDYIGSAIKYEIKPKLSIGVTYDINDGAVKERGQLGSFIQDASGSYIGKTLQTVFVDFMYKHKNFSMMGEFAHKKTSDDDPLVFDDASTLIGTFFTGSGYVLQAGYMMPKNVELAFRYTTITPDETVSDDEKEYTLGLSKYIVGHKLKVQSDLTYRDREISNDKLFWRIQMDIHF